MTEQVFRFVMGASLWVALLTSAYFDSMLPIYILMGVLLFEGLTNWRIPIIISRIRYGRQYKDHIGQAPCNNGLLGKIEAERMLRFVVVIFVMISYYLVPDLIWFLPWFVTAMLILAGITNICPMVIFLRWAGLR